MAVYGLRIVGRTREHLMDDCGEPGCGRRGLCLPALDFSNGHEGMTSEDAVPERLDRFGFALHSEAFQTFLPLHGSVQSAVRRLCRIHRKPWRLLCARCLALKFVRQKFTRWTGDIFGGTLSAKLRTLDRRKDMGRAVDRLLPQLEEYVVEDLRAMRRRIRTRERRA